MEASALSAPVSISRLSLSGPLLRLRSDEQLVALFRAGSDAAFDAIHDRYRVRLLAYSRQMLGGSRQDAEDALQDVFLRAYGALRANDRPISLRAWLYRVAHNRCIDQLRRPAPAQADVFETSRTPGHDPLAEAEQREDLRRLVADVRRLPESQRSALLMREMEGLSYEELAGALETTVPAIKSLLVRARLGLVEAAEARDTACPEIRTQLAAASDRGVRASGQARRHLRECAGCREYRGQLRQVRRSFAALAPAGLGPIGLLAQALGIGGSGAGAGAAAVGSGSGAGAVALGGGAAVATAGKVAAIVVGVGVVAAGAAEEATKQAAPAHHARPAATTVAPARGAALFAPVRETVDGRVQHLRLRVTAPATAKDPAAAAPGTGTGTGTATPATGTATAPAIAPVDPLVTGGTLAPDEAPGDTAATGTTDPTPAPGTAGATGQQPADPAGGSAGSGTTAPGPASGSGSGSGTPAGSSGSQSSGAQPPAGSAVSASASGP